MVVQDVTVRGTGTCRYCETDFEIPAGRYELTESTRDYPPPAECAIYGVEQGQRINFTEPNYVILHRCKRGVPVPV